LYYSIILDSIDISILSKGKTFAFTNSIEVYSKEVLNDEICRLTIANVQLMTNKIKIEKTKVNLEIDRIRLFGEKNFLIVKREKLRTEIVLLNIAGLFNILIYGHQNPFLRFI